MKCNVTYPVLMQPTSLFIPTPLFVYKPPRITKTGSYTTHTKHKQRLQWYLKSQVTQLPFDGPICVNWLFVRPIPKGVSKVKRNQMLARTIVPTTRPDCSNYQKFFEDVFIGILWHDDSQIVSYTGAKVYGQVEGVQVHVQPYIYY
jgi:Holliday junction resolvase RusA-like endonuclease